MTKLLYILIFTLFSSSFAAQVCSKVVVKNQFGNETVTVNCSNPLEDGGLTLTADAPILRSTESYTVSSRSYEPQVSFSVGTPMNAHGDDTNLQAVSLPFSFCFFGKSYNKIVPSTNGSISLDESLAGQASVGNISATNPDTSLPLNSIFGVRQDLIFDENDPSEIFWTVTGEEGCRKFILNYYEARIVGCDERTTFQIVLHENTNIIEVFIDKRSPNCESARHKNSLVGILDESGTRGYSPPGRNTGIWSADDEAWVFSPENPVSPSFIWRNSKNEIFGNSATIQIKPTQTEVYSVQANYPTCVNAQSLSDEVTVNFAPDYPLAKDASVNLCSEAGTATVNLQSYNPQVTSQPAENFNFRYYRTEVEAFAGGTPLGDSQNLTADTSFFVRIENPSNPSCFSVAEIKFKIAVEHLARDLIDVCDFGNDGREEVELNIYRNMLLPDFGGTILFFNSENEARANANPLGFTTINPATELWLRAEKDGCVNILGPVRFNFKPTADVNSPLLLTLEMCDINFDGSEPFDWKGTFDAAVTSTPGVVISYHATLEDARALRNPLTRIRGGKYIVYVAVQKDGCISIATIDVDVTFNSVRANKEAKDICFNGTEDISVDLAQLSAGMLVDSQTGITKTYHATRAAAEAGTSPLGPDQVITSDGNLVSKTFFVRFREGPTCYTVRELVVRLIHPVTFKAEFEICDFLNDNSENVTLSQFTNTVKGTQNATVTYFLTRESSENNTGAITTYNVTGSAQLFVRVTSFGCTEVYPLKIRLTPTPEVNKLVEKTVNEYCDNNADSHEPFNLRALEPEIFSGDGVTFSYFLDYSEANRAFSSPISRPEAFVTSSNSTVFVKVTDDATQCFSVSRVELKINFLPPINLKPASLSLCDTEFNANETFNLNNAVPDLFNASENTWPLSDFHISFYESQAQANFGGTEGLISSGTFTTRATTVAVYARFTHKTYGCFSVAPINLLTVVPPKVLNSTITVCDNDLDGMYDVNLLNFTSRMVDVPDERNIFTFYRSRDDAQQGRNAISNPENFEEEAFPNQLWVRAEILPGCYDINFINFRFGTKTTVPASRQLISDICDNLNDGIETLDLRRFESIAGAVYEYFESLADLNNNQNRIPDPSKYVFDASKNTSYRIFVKVTSGTLCPALLEIEIALKRAPVFSTEEIYYFCPGGLVDIRPNLAGLNIVSYNWRNARGETVSTDSTLRAVSTEGMFSLTVTDAEGCTHTESFEVKQRDVPLITKINVTGNIYTVNATGSKSILYRANDGLWQTGNTFTGLPVGVNTFNVKFAEDECLGNPRQAVVLDIPNVITPNEDSLNDVWIITGLHVFEREESTIKLADRFGKIVFEQRSNTQFTWNGHYSSRPVPTGTYWYAITLPDGRQQTGWLLVKNRN